jgi:hypothetical protein
MPVNNKGMKTDANSIPVSQYYNRTIDDFEPIEGSLGGMNVHLAGSQVVEQKTEAQAIAGTVTFAQNIKHIEIYNTDAVNSGVFTVNGIGVTVPKSETFKASFGGTPSKDVTVIGATSYILTRYE